MEKVLLYTHRCCTINEAMIWKRNEDRSSMKGNILVIYEAGGIINNVFA